jgi:hypothetical protein
MASVFVLLCWCTSQPERRAATHRRCRSLLVAAYVSIRQPHTSAYVSIRQHTPAYLSAAPPPQALPLPPRHHPTPALQLAPSSGSPSSPHLRRRCALELRQYLCFCTSSCVSICTFALANLSARAPWRRRLRCGCVLSCTSVFVLLYQ